MSAFGNCFIILLNVLVFHEVSLAKSDLETIRERVVVELMKPHIEDAKIAALIKTINEDGSWSNINYKDVSLTGFDHRNHLSNMVIMSRAYKRKGSKWHKNKGVKNAIEASLGFWVANDFICDNWWHNQIGTTSKLVAVMLIMDKDLPKDLIDKTQPIIGRAHLNASGARPS